METEVLVVRNPIGKKGKKHQGMATALIQLQGNHLKFGIVLMKVVDAKAYGVLLY
jgi:hypothetical protein